jgi:hypothetical protein
MDYSGQNPIVIDNDYSVKIGIVDKKTMVLLVEKESSIVDASNGIVKFTFEPEDTEEAFIEVGARGDSFPFRSAYYGMIYIYKGEYATTPMPVPLDIIFVP